MSSVLEILERAAHRVREGWDADALADDPALAEALDLLVGRIEGAGPDAPEGLSYEGGDPAVARQLIDALRAQSLLEWQERPDRTGAGRYLDALAALESLSAGELQGNPRRMPGPMADPDGFELLIEAVHDLRSPLTSIVFLSETLRNGHSGAVNGLQRSQLGLIYGAAQAMSSMIADVMYFARSGKDLLEGPAEVFSISAVLDDIERLLLPVAEEKGVDLMISHGAHDRVRGHSLAVSRVLLNLATNALKFTDEGHVLVATRQVDHETVEFRVEDTGRGMTEEQQAGLHELSSSRPWLRLSGPGLGLSIVGRLLQAMESTLVFETAPAEGTDFSFRLRLPPVAHL